ncbi:MAG: ATP-binding protein, partial [Nanoarchaeota archaeon]
REVDVLLRINEDIFPFEVKYQNKISRQDYSGLHHFQKGILITKNFLDIGEKYAAIPVHLFLSVI